MKGGEKMKYIQGLVLILLSLFVVTPAFAHVVVSPKQAGVASYQTFTLGVPNERDVPTVALRLVIPEGVSSVSPNVKPGWTIDSKKENGSAEGATVTEITWTGGLIPSGQRDDFLFSAQVPANEATLAWKVYQTYEDGTVVSWDQKPTQGEGDDDLATSGPYAETAVSNDLAPVAKPEVGSVTDTKAIALAMVALLFGLISIAMQVKKRG